MRILIVDGANVVGSRPTGWWRDRAGAAHALHQSLATAALDYDQVVLVLEGEARKGQPAGEEGPLHTVHASGSGDDEIVAQVQRGAEANDVVVVTADRALRDRVAAAGGSSLAPRWLLERI